MDTTQFTTEPTSHPAIPTSGVNALSSLPSPKKDTAGALRTAQTEPPRTAAKENRTQSEGVSNLQREILYQCCS